MKRPECSLFLAACRPPVFAAALFLAVIAGPAGAEKGKPEGPALCNGNVQTAIGLIGAENPVVRGDGSLVEPGGAVLFGVVSPEGKMIGKQGLDQRLHEGRYPVVVTTFTEGGRRCVLTAFTAPLSGGPCDVVRIETSGGGAPAELAAFFEGGGVRAAGPTGLRVGGRCVSWDGGARLRSISRSWGFDPGPEIRGLRGWARPKEPADPAFANVRVGFDGRPIRYRFSVEPGKTFTAALGICEGWWSEAGRRIIVLEVEGAPARTVDTVKDLGPNTAGVFLFAGRDADGDGFLDVTCRAAPGAPDRNCILNTIWILETPLKPGGANRLKRRAGDLPLLYGVDCGGPSDQAITPEMRLVWSLGGQEEKGAVRYVALSRTPGAPPLEFTADSLDRALQAAAGYWKEVYARGARLHVPDRDVEDLYFMSLANVFMLRDDGEGVSVVKPGETCYDGFWYRDGAYLAVAQDMAGYPGEAERSLELFWRDDLPESLKAQGQEPNGAWDVPRTEWDGQGQALWALFRHFELTGDRSWLEKVYPAVRRGMEWIRAARLETKGRKGAPDSLFRGLFPEGFGERIDSRPGFILYHDFWGVLGARCGWRIAEALGKPDASWMRREYEDFRGCLARCCERAAIRLEGESPVIPGALGRPGALIWGAVAAIFPCEALPLHSPQVEATFRVMEKRSVEGLYRFVSEDKIWPYISTDWARAYLYRGEPGKALSIFRAYVDHASPTRGWIEEIFVKSRVGTGDMPHGWAAADYVMLLRDMLLLERGTDLHFCPAVDSSLLPPGESIAAEGLPTSFGTVSFDVARPGGKELVFTVRGDWRRAPERLVFHPLAGTTVRGIAAADPAATVGEGTVILSGEASKRRKIALEVRLDTP